MSDQQWTPAIGLRRATISLTWRTAVAAIVWCVLLWVFHAAISGMGLASVPMIIALGFAAVAGSVAGLIISRGLDEIAGFVSPLLTLLALAFGAIAVIGAEAVFESVNPTSTGHLRFIIVCTTMIVASAWIVKFTLVDN